MEGRLHTLPPEYLTPPPSRFDLNQITPVILTFNEAPNIARCLDRLSWASRVVMIDSLSQDGTNEIVKRYPRVTVFQRRFDNHTAQWNFGLSKASTDWILALDADYILSNGFHREIENLDPASNVVAYYARIKYAVAGKPLRACLYPPRAVLFRKSACHYKEDGHTQLLEINGESRYLSGAILHDDRKSLSSWLQAQDRYAILEASKLSIDSPEDLQFTDKVRQRIVLAPPLVFIHTLLAKRLILDGWAGWHYVFQRILAESLLSLRLLERKLGQAVEQEISVNADGSNSSRAEQANQPRVPSDVAPSKGDEAIERSDDVSVLTRDLTNATVSQGSVQSADSRRRRHRHHRQREKAQKLFRKRRIANFGVVCLAAGAFAPLAVFETNKGFLFYGLAGGVALHLCALLLGLISWKYARAKVTVLLVVFFVAYAGYLFLRTPPPTAPNLEAPSSDPESGGVTF